MMKRYNFFCLGEECPPLDQPATGKYVLLSEAQAEIDAYKQDLERTIAEKVDKNYYGGLRIHVMQAEIDKYKKLIDQIETACDYTNSAYNIQLLINDHKGE